MNERTVFFATDFDLATSEWLSLIESCDGLEWLVLYRSASPRNTTLSDLVRCCRYETAAESTSVCVRDTLPTYPSSSVIAERACRRVATWVQGGTIT